jgi:putative ABC transport system substrate-binding protein
MNIQWSAVIVALGLFGVVSTPVAAQQVVPLAQDGGQLDDEPFATRATFRAVWGDRAGARWLEEHNAALAVGRPATVPRVGFLNPFLQGPNRQSRDTMLQAVRDVGYAPGRDIIFEWRYSEGRNEALPSLANELVNLRVDLIYASEQLTAQAAQRATSTIPIVSPALGANPVQLGLVTSLERPGGNLTGVLTAPEATLYPKRLELLKQTVPSASRIAVLRNPDGPTTEAAYRAVQDAAARLGLQIEPVDARTDQDIPGAVETARQRADAMLTASDNLFTINRRRIGELAIQNKLIVMAQGRPAVDEGGLMTYVVQGDVSARLAANYMDRILKGGKVADLPVLLPNEYDFVINLKAAEAIGLTSPQACSHRRTSYSAKDVGRVGQRHGRPGRAYSAPVVHLQRWGKYPWLSGRRTT